MKTPHPSASGSQCCGKFFVAAALFTLAVLPGIQAADYMWTGAVDNNWNLTTANWTGAGTTWVNGTDSHALINTPGADITFDSTLTVGTLTLGADTIFRSTGSFGIDIETLTLAGTASNVQFLDYMVLGINAANGVSSGNLSFDSAATLVGYVGNAISGGTQTFYDGALNAFAVNAVSGGTQTFYSLSVLDARAVHAVSGGDQAFYDESVLIAADANAVIGGDQTFYDDSRLRVISSNGVSGGAQTFNNESRLEAVAANAVSGGTQIFNDSSELNVEVSNGLSGGEQTFYDFSVLRAVVENAVTGGTQTFHDTSTLVANTAIAVSGGVQNFHDSSILGANAANAVSGGNQTFYDTSSLTAYVSYAVVGGTQTFYDTSSIWMTAPNTLTGGSQTFYDSSLMYADDTDTISGGTQTFNDASHLYAKEANSLSGGVQTFYDASYLEAVSTHSVSGGSITLFHEAEIQVSALNALTTAVPVTFNNSLGGTGGRLWLRGNSTTVGLLTSAAPGSGLIENDDVDAAVLTTESAVDSTFSGLVRDGAGGGALSLVKSGAGTFTLTGPNTYSGGTSIDAGTLQTASVSALGSGGVGLNHGVLQPLSSLSIDTLGWNFGKLRLVLGPTLLHIDNQFTNGGSGGTFVLDWDQATPLQEQYTLLTYGGTTNFTGADFTGEADFDSVPNVTVQSRFLLTGNAVLLALTAQASGPLLQNSAPVNIPTFADFFVRGQVRTGEFDENNTIKSLTFDPGSNLKVYNNLTVSSGNFTVSGGKATIQGGTVLVPGVFHKYGPGTLDASTDVLVAGNSFIHSGALAVNGTFATPLLHVLGGGTLMGNGTVFGNVLNSGTVAPGNSVGHLHIQGNYTQKSSGTLQIEAASASHHDVLSVSGTARLGGTLEVVSLGYKPKYGDQLPFLRAGKITGKFNRITMPDRQVNRGRFLNLGNLGVLLVAPSSYTLVAETPNQTRVASALDQWIGIEDGDIGATTLALDLLRKEQYPQAFEAIMPGFHEAALSTAVELSHSQGQMLHQQLSARRLGQRPSPPSLGQRTLAGADGKTAKSVRTVDPALTAPEADDSRWSTWMQGSGLFSQGGLSLVPGEDFESGTFLVGADYALSEHFTVGLFASYGEGWGDYDNGGQIDLERVTFGGYATVDLGNFYLNAALGGGSVDYDIQRPVQFATLNRKARSNPDGTEFFGLLGGGYDFRRGNWTFGPQASLQYSRVSMDSFRERGADSLDLRLADADSESLRSYLGARVAYTIALNDRMALIPEVRAFWQHEYLEGGSLNASLDGGQGPAFIYDMERNEKDALFLGAGIGLQVGPRFYANLYYNVELGREAPNHSVSLSVTVKF